MGLHTGEPRVGGERYVGIGVHRAARIGAAGHGGQVLLSSTTRELAEEDLPPGVGIRDLGERRLKDLEQRQRLYQLVIEGLPSEFKPLRTLDVELKRKRRRMYAGSALIGVVAAAVAIPVFAFGQGGSGGNSVQVAPNSVAVIDPKTNKVTADVSVGARPAEIVAGFGAVWVANLDDGTVSRIDPKTRRVVRTIPINVEPTGLTAGAGGIWYASAAVASGFYNVPRIELGRIDPAFNNLVRAISLRNAGSFGTFGPLAAGSGAVWVTSAGGVIRYDPARQEQTRTDTGTIYGSRLTGVAADAEGTWVSDVGLNKVSRIDPSTQVVTAQIPVGNGPSAIAVSRSGVWVTDTPDDAVVRIDPATNAVKATIEVGRNPTGVGVGAGAVWVANSGDGTVSELDPRTDSVTRTFRVGGSPAGIVVAGGLVWVSVQEGGTGAGGVLAAGRQGGTARVDSPANPLDKIDGTDPAIGATPGDWQVQYATCAKLVNYPDRPGPAGAQLVPEVARSMPHRSADGRTYTFNIREGYRFSPPSNQPVTAATFKYAIERSLAPQTKGPAVESLDDVIGAKAFEAGKASHIAGIRVHGNSLTIRVSGSDESFGSAGGSGTLLARLAMPFFCAVPIGTPVDPNGLKTIPSAGPYYVASYQPSRSLVLKRNANYRGPRPHRLDEIDIALNVGQAQAIAEVESGQADYAPWSQVSVSEHPRLVARYGPKSSRARADKQQYFVNPRLVLAYFALNTTRPLFASVRMRQAVNFAIDRQALVKVEESQEPRIPTDQYLPPGIAGFQDARIYPLRGDLARARSLAGTGIRKAVLYTSDRPTSLSIAHVLASNLAAIGIHLEVDTFNINVFFKKIYTPGEPWDIASTGWLTDGYYDPFDFLNLLFDGRLEKRYSGFSTFDDPTYDRKLAAAAKLTGAPRLAAYARLDADLARNAAPVVAWSNWTSQDFFSARMGCQLFKPYGMDLAALCIRGHARK
jgi:peptide/nickel transport system substrate-binding protein